MGNLIEFAKSELKAAGLLPEPDVAREVDYDGKIGPAVLTLLGVLSKQGHSGGSHYLATDLFAKLARFEPLSPVTGADDEWVDVSSNMGGEPMFQNRRNGRLFKDDLSGRARYIDAIVWQEEDGSRYTGTAWLNNERYYSSQLARFPFEDKTFYVDVFKAHISGDPDDYVNIVKDQRQLDAVFEYYDRYVLPAMPERTHPDPTDALTSMEELSVSPGPPPQQHTFVLDGVLYMQEHIIATDRQAAISQFKAIHPDVTNISVDRDASIGGCEDSGVIIFSGDDYDTDGEVQWTSDEQRAANAERHQQMKLDEENASE